MEIKRILRPLSDGKWHQLEDLSNKTNIDRQTIYLVANSLKDFGFIEINSDKTAVKLTESFLRL